MFALTRSKRARNPALTAFASLPFALLAACAADRLPEPPAPAETEAQRLVQDVRYATAAIRALHPNPFRASGRSAFDAEIVALERRGEALDAETAFLALMRLVALAGDSHTRLASWDPIGQPSLPISIRACSDGYFIGAVQEGYGKLCHERLLAIEGVPVDELVRRLSPYVPHENEIVLENGAAGAMRLPRLLAVIDVAEDDGMVTLSLEDAGDVEVERRRDTGSWFFIAPEGWQLRLRDQRRDEPWWWIELDQRTFYLAYNSCSESDEQPFAPFAADLLAKLAHAGRDSRLVVDLRNNGGGDSRVLRPLLDGLRAEGVVGPDRLRVLIGRDTYSSAMLNALALSRDLDGVLIGEPTGQKPDAFGEIRSFALPNTGWRMDCSTVPFALTGDGRPSLAPDLLVPSGYRDFLGARDPQLERALE